MRRDSRSNITAILMFFGLTILMALAGCSREASQKQPVQSSSASGSSTAPASASAAHRDKALVRVVNAIPGGKPVDLIAGANILFAQVEYKNVTEYREVADDRTLFKIRPTGHGDHFIAENGEGLSGGSHYTLVAVSKPDQLTELLALSDNLTPPARDKAKVRIVHASPDTGEVDVFISGEKFALFGGVNANSETMYTEVDPRASASLEVRPQGRKNTVLTIRQVNFEAGKIYTFILAGKAKGSPRLEAIRIEDSFVARTAVAAR